MSNLGKVYEIYYREKVKRAYPVVYKNKTYYYCKVYGCDTLLAVPTVEASPTSRPYKKVISLNDYKKMLVNTPDNEFRGYVYVSSQEEYYFTELKIDVLAVKLDRVKNDLRQLNFFMEANNHRLHLYEEENKNYSREIANLTAKKEELEAELLSRNKKAVKNND